MEDIDSLAEGLISGEIEATCPYTRETIEKVRNGEISFDSFKEMIKLNKTI